MSPNSRSSGSPRLAPRAGDTFPERLEPSYAHHLADGTWPNAGVKDLQLSLHATPGAPAVARRCARDFFAQRVPGPELRDTLLMLTELVTNAVRHASAPAGGFVDVHLGISARRLRVEVRDVGAGFDLSEPRADPARAGGYGLVIVDRVCSRWGVSDAGPHCVWFELDQPP